MSVYLGIDIGGTKIAGAMVTRDGAVVKKAARATPARDGGSAILSAAIAMGQDLLAKEHGDLLAGIGVGTGGQVDSERGVVVSATDLLPGWAGTPLKEAFEDAFPAPVHVDNDVNALALGEARFGAGRGYCSMALLALGTGVGGAWIENGRLLRGAHWSGAEFGHMILSMDPGARVDAGGGRGTLEAYASGHGLVQTWREITGELHSPITGEEIARAASKNPHGAEALAIARTGEYLGYGLASLANVLDPDVFVIGGGLSTLGEALLSPARRILAARALPGPATCPVLAAALGESGGAIGAACLIMP